jgi:hypothetical protein
MSLRRHLSSAAVLAAACALGPVASAGAQVPVDPVPPPVTLPPVSVPPVGMPPLSSCPGWVQISTPTAACAPFWLVWPNGPWGSLGDPPAGF